MCALPFLEELAKAGVMSFKIEGRMRSPEYVKTVVSVYRKFIDSGYDKKLVSSLMEKLKEVYNREFHSGNIADYNLNDNNCSHLVRKALHEANFLNDWYWNETYSNPSDLNQDIFKQNLINNLSYLFQ